MSANSLLVIGMLIQAIAEQAAGAGRADLASRHRLADVSVTAVTLVSVGDGAGVIRGSAGAIEVVRIGDLVGKTKAVVSELSGGRLVLEETFTEKDGRPNRALIVIKEGERGGTRYLQRAGEPAFMGTKPQIIMPAAPDPATPAPKKPPQM